MLFIHARVGIGVAFGEHRRHMLALDAGCWFGGLFDRKTDAAGVETRTSRRILWPMAGFAYLYAF